MKTFMLRIAKIKIADKFSLPLRRTALETTEIFRLNELETPRTAVDTAVSLLRAGQLIAVPTDTIYGLAANAGNYDAATLLYNVKGREHTKPLAICVGSVADVYKWGKVCLPEHLLQALLPGPVTLLLEPHQEQNLKLPGNPKLVGIRVPDHKFICAVANKLGFPLALTSANISGEPSSIDPIEFKHLWPKLSAVFDGGVIHNHDEVPRSGSTVVDLSKEGFFKIIRAGIGYNFTKKLLLENGLQEIQ